MKLQGKAPRVQPTEVRPTRGPSLLVWKRRCRQNVRADISHRHQRLIQQESAAKDQAITNAITAKNGAEEERRRANRISYASDMIGAYQALQLDNLGLARTLRQRHADDSATADLRNWEWRGLSLSCEGDYIEALRGYRDWTLCEGAFGSWLVVKVDDGLEIRELTTREVVKKSKQVIHQTWAASRTAVPDRYSALPNVRPRGKDRTS